MSLARRASFLCKSAALWAAMAATTLCIGVGALGLFIAALVVWITHQLGFPAAAAIAGGFLLILGLAIAGIVTWILRRMRARQPGLVAEAMSLLGLGLRLASFTMQRGPGKALLAALLAGAVAEHFSGRQPKE